MFGRFGGSKVLVAAAFVGALALPERAEACGGFFCSQTPIDQTAERILFRINTDETVSAYVQIAYNGDRDAFAWIVPVPSAVALDTFPQLALRALDMGTQPQYFNNSCYLLERAGVPTAADSDGADEDSGVTLLQQQNVGPFGTVTIEGNSAEELVAWLRENDYRITDEMIPFIEKYVMDGMKFLAMRLLPDADVADIEPIVMTYQGTKPMIPIRLTTVAAQPEMGIVAWVLAEQRYAPENYVDLKVDDAEITFDQWGYNNNYLTVVSRKVDEVGGHAFVTEFAGPTAPLAEIFRNTPVSGNQEGAEEANQELIALLESAPYITRLYSRMSAEEMTIDPIFGVAKDTADVSNIHDLSDPDEVCEGPTPVPAPCDFTYCGRSGVCVELADANQAVAACACAGDATARPTNTTAGQLSVYCEPVALNLMPSEDLALVSCAGFSCGDHGECVAMNGNPTCRCDAGYAAVASQAFDPATGAPMRATMNCVEVMGELPPLPSLPPIGMVAPVEQPDEPGTPMLPDDAEDADVVAPVTPPAAVDNNNMPQAMAGAGGGGCRVAAPGAAGTGSLASLAFLMFALFRRQRTAR